jgi:hypothetical protein
MKDAIYIFIHSLVFVHSFVSSCFPSFLPYFFPSLIHSFITSHPSRLDSCPSCLNTLIKSLCVWSGLQWGWYIILTYRATTSHSLFQLAVWDPVMSVSLKPLRSSWGASNLKQTLLSPPDYKHLIWMSSARRYKPCCHDKTNSEMSMLTMWRSGVYHLLHMCHAQIAVRIHFSASQCLLPYFLTFPLFSPRQ